MKSICVGVHVHAEPRRLQETLASLSANTAHDFQLLLLPDGPDSATSAALSRMSDTPQAATARPTGAAACFNRLANYNKADVVVLLESGCVVGPNWLSHLLAALDADARNGLAGPSTNRSWNEQNIRPRGGDSAREVARVAREAEMSFAGETRTLEPLYSLADFCYAVRREVIEAVGGADEGYATGPCWEMDYNVRAARAGFRGVWARAAYVHRAPFTARRSRDEERQFEASRRLYQNKFCGARLRGEKSDFREHCRGDDCPNFAPAELIRLRLELPADRTTLSPAPAPSRAAAPRSFHKPAPTPAPVLLAALPPLKAPQLEFDPQSSPLVTCIMPTFDRRSYVPQAVRCFLRQDYPNLELLVVDDGTDPVRDCVPEDERIRYIRLDRRLKLGEKRNFACEHARGEFIVHWDDDDWYPSWRVSAQVSALLGEGADVSGTSRVYFYDAGADRAWEYCYGSRKNSWVAGSTLAYRKSFWARNKFPDISIGEDSRFLWSRVPKKIADLADSGLCVASVHPRNTSRKTTGGSYWHARPSALIHELLGDERYLYRTACRASSQSAWPLVTCIMPTFDRRPLVPLALRGFCSQDYPNKELIVVDDGTDPVGDLTAGLPGVRYVRLPRRTSIGTKRNIACEHGRGEIITHWDDDDWYAPDRLRYQVAPLIENEADLTGLVNTCVLELPGGNFWTTDAGLHQKMFVGDVHGGTLAYRRELLSGALRYPEVNLAEDAYLIRRALKSGKRLMRMTNPGVFVYVRHGRNAWRQCQPGRFINPAGWERVERPRTFPADLLSSYKEAVALIGEAPPQGRRRGGKVL
jgi:glycosyltransferase involved in cell wall biosynthesis